MIRLPWQRWKKPPPPDAEAMARSYEMVRQAKLRELDTMRALSNRRVVVVSNHIAHDVHKALERRSE